MKSCIDYINKAVQTELNKILKEDENSQEDVLDTFHNMDSFIKDEKKQSDIAIKNSLKLMSALTDPIKRNSETVNMKVQKDRMKKLDTMKKSIDDQEKAFKDNAKKSTSTNKLSIAPQTSSQVNTQTTSQTSSMSESKKVALPILKRKFIKEEGEIASEQPIASPVPNQPPVSKKAYLVQFDKDTNAPFNVKFTERGFSINDTRLSFEALENALSKNYTITLNNGKGLMLDAIRMQKILKYKNRFFNGQ